MYLDPLYGKELHYASTCIPPCATQGNSPKLRLAQVNSGSNGFTAKRARRCTNQFSYSAGPPVPEADPASAEGHWAPAKYQPGTIVTMAARLAGVSSGTWATGCSRGFGGLASRCGSLAEIGRLRGYETPAECMASSTQGTLQNCGEHDID